MSEQRNINFRFATKGLRNAVFEGRDHLVVPVVALVEGVLHAVNAKSPELALASEFGKFTMGWNGEPVMMNHPVHEDQMVSANSPSILEKFQIGRIFDTHLDGDKLRMNAYLDIARIDNVGSKAQQLLKRFSEDGLAEVSVGVFVDAEAAAGVYKGKPYSRIWRHIVPDHLAFLEDGVVGACSNEAGCGAGSFRTAIHVVTSEGFTLEGVQTVTKKTFLESLKEFIAGVEEEPVVPAEPVAPVVEPVAACGCKDKPVVSAESAEGGQVHKNAERITALIANPKSPWEDADRTHLESKTDEQLATLEAFGKEPETKKEEPVVAAAAPKAELKLEELPETWQRLIRTAEANEKATRISLVEKLTAAQDAFSAADLEAMGFDQLQKLGKAVLKAELVDFSAAAGAPRMPASKSDDNYAEEPPDLGAMFRPARKTS